MKKILIYGYYGVSNLGDDYILYSLLSNLADIPAEINVFSHGDSYEYLRKLLPGINMTVLLLPVNRVREFFAILFHVLKNDYFIVGGGGIYPYESRWDLVKQYLYIRLGVIWKTRSCILGVDINSIERKKSKCLWKKILHKIDFFTSRNKKSYHMLAELNGVPNEKLHSFSDLTFGLETLDEKTEEGSHVFHKLNNETYVLWCLAMPYSTSELQLEYCQNRYKNLCSLITETMNGYPDGYYHVFLPFYYENDLRFINDIKAGLKSRYLVADHNSKLEFASARLLFKYAHHIVAMRFHSVLFSVFYKKRFAAISYSPKTTQFMKDHDLDNFTEYGISNNKFFYREFDLDKEQLHKLIMDCCGEHIDVSRIEKASETCRDLAGQQFTLLTRWIKETESEI